MCFAKNKNKKHSPRVLVFTEISKLEWILIHWHGDLFITDHRSYWDSYLEYRDYERKSDYFPSENAYRYDGLVSREMNELDWTGVWCESCVCELLLYNNGCCRFCCYSRIHKKMLQHKNYLVFYSKCWPNATHTHTH